MKDFLKRFLFAVVAKKFKMGYTNNHKKELVKFCEAAKVSLKKSSGEDEFIKKWKGLYKDVNVDFYRFYSQFIGEDPNIVSDDIFHIVIEPILNNQVSLATYSDKNMYEKLLPRDILPTCILRNIEYDYMDQDYKILNMDEALFDRMILNNEKLISKKHFIIKPTTDTCAGAGVRLFKYENGKWLSNDGDVLTLTYLNRKYKSNFILQECIETSPFVKQFNETSYSTFRIITYRSVVDDKPVILGGYMRVGAKGSFKDNIWGGGYACSINDDGTLANFASDATRQKYDNINGVSLVDNKFVIPNFDKIRSLVYQVVKAITPNRIMSFDVILDEENNPHIIEFNIKHQTVTTLQTLRKSYFGEYTDEVIDYCKKHMSKICYQMNIRK